MSGTGENIAAVLKQAAAEVLGLDPETLTLDARLREDLGVDSIDIFDMLALLSKRLKQDFEGDDFARVVTVGDFVARLEELVAN